MKKLALIILFFIPALGHAQTAPSQVTLNWTNPTAATTSVIVFRGTCAGKVTGTAQADGAIVGQCTLALAQSALVSYFTIAGPTAPITICTPQAAANGCFLDNAVAACISAGCVYDIEVVTSNGTSIPSGTIAVSWNAPPVVVPPPTPPPPATNLTIIAHAKTTSGNNQTLSASWKDKPGVPTACILWGSGKVVKTCAPTPTPTGAYSFSWSGPAVVAASLDVCDDVMGCLPQVNF